MRYWIEAEDLWAADESGLRWRGRPDGCPVVFATSLPGTDDAIALLNAESGPRNSLGDAKGWPHLVRVRADGTVVWRAAAGLEASDQDWWVSVDVTADGLFANTWSCYRRRLDEASGRVLSSVFTK